MKNKGGDKIKNKKYIIILITIIIISIYSNAKAKYIIQNEFCIANINIDMTKPIIEIINIENTNDKYKNYANKNHIIKIKVQIIEKNIKEINMDNKHVKIKVGDSYASEENVSVKNIDDLLYEIEIKQLKENGELIVEILENTIIDNGDLTNDLKKINTQIIIDNTVPSGTFQEIKIENGKVNGIINMSEEIIKLEGWRFNENGLSANKEFTNNISYELPIMDFAGNEGKININITQAIYIEMIYAAHNSEIGWSFGYGNYDIVGKSAIKENDRYKIEALAFNISGNIEDDFVKGKAYVHTHWGIGVEAICDTSNMKYKGGYCPSEKTYKTMKSKDLVTINNKKYFQFGGAGINKISKTDINGNNGIPADISVKYPYGISGIEFKLKDYSNYSIIYQILTHEKGWIKTCSDGEECMYKKDKPISAYRMALVPKTEKEYIINTWNKDIGRHNID